VMARESLQQSRAAINAKELRHGKKSITPP
jgi:hypothetical protein